MKFSDFKIVQYDSDQHDVKNNFFLLKKKFWGWEHVCTHDIGGIKNTNYIDRIYNESPIFLANTIVDKCIHNYNFPYISNFQKNLADFNRLPICKYPIKHSFSVKELRDAVTYFVIFKENSSAIDPSFSTFYTKKIEDVYCLFKKRYKFNLKDCFSYSISIKENGLTKIISNKDETTNEKNKGN